MSQSTFANQARASSKRRILASLRKIAIIDLLDAPLFTRKLKLF